MLKESASAENGFVAKNVLAKQQNALTSSFQIGNDSYDISAPNSADIDGQNAKQPPLLPSSMSMPIIQTSPSPAPPAVSIIFIG